MNITRSQILSLAATRPAIALQLSKGDLASSPALDDANSLPAMFLRRWEAIGGPVLVREYQFHPTRRWRLDLAHVETRTAVEMHGGVHAKGRHTTGPGFVGDRSKMNAATARGWAVFELTPAHLDDGESVGQVLATLRGRESGKAQDRSLAAEGRRADRERT